MEVSENGDMQTGKFQENGKRNGGGHGFSMASENIVAMMHVNKAGQSKILKMQFTIDWCWLREK
jgi:hypothetical protein